MRPKPKCQWGLLILVLLAGSLPAADVSPLLRQIKAVGKEGKGNAEASRALRELTRQGPEALLDVLAAMDDAGPVALNWLRAAVEAISDKTLTAGKPLPAARLEAFVRDTRHSGPARRLAYECLVRVDAEAPDRLLPGMLNDPGAELRRDAVAVVLDKAQKLFDKEDKAAALAAYKKALEVARDQDQVNLAAQRLKKLGVDIDLTAHFGFVTQWMVIGPFDNSDGKGFHTVFPPEKAIDVKAAYKGKDGKQIGWTEHTTEAALGLVDFNKIFGELKGVTAYAFTTVISPSEREVEVRAGSNNAVRIFLNGKEIFFREEYHHGMQMDQHRGRAVLKAGRNQILIKVCQNEQTEDWAQLWSFQLRITDAIGGAVPVTVVRDKTTSTGGGQR
jgi:hypothetical protein